MKTDVETQLRDYWGAVYEASPTLVADDVRHRPVRVDRQPPRRAAAWSPAWAIALAAFVVVVLIGGAAVLLGSRTPTDAVDEPDRDPDLLLDYPTSEIPPFRADIRLTDPPPGWSIEGLVTVSYGGKGLFRVDVTQEIRDAAAGPLASIRAAAGSFTVIRDGGAVDYDADENTAVRMSADLRHGEREPFPFFWESWNDLCTFGGHVFLEPETVAGRNTIRLRCMKGSDTYELWVDEETGLLLRVAGAVLPSIAMPGWLDAAEYEVLSVEYEPRFPEGLFELTVPQGATVDSEVLETELALLEIGQTAPALEGTSLDGAVFDLTELRGERIVILFWGSWCAPCTDALEDIAALAEGTGDVVFVTVLFQDRADDARAALLDRGIDLLVIELAGSSDDSYEKAWGISGVPTFMLVDRDGTVAGSLEGYSPIDTIEGLLHDAGW